MYQSVTTGRTTPLEIIERNRSDWLTGMTAAMFGLIASAVILPVWLPGLADSVMVADPKIFWYLSRATAIMGFLILTLSMAWGLLMTAKMAKYWPGVSVANDLHKFVSLTGIFFGVFHAFILLGDKYIGFTVAKILIPFANPIYRPTWAGLGQISLYVWGILLVSFWLRKKIDHKLWRGLHYATFALWLAVLAHGIFSGTDTGTSLMNVIYWGSSAIILFLIFYRILSAMVQKTEPKPVKVLPRAATSPVMLPAIPKIQVYDKETRDRTTI
jgi:predicted ferric reductase